MKVEIKNENHIKNLICISGKWKSKMNLKVESESETKMWLFGL